MLSGYESVNILTSWNTIIERAQSRTGLIKHLGIEFDLSDGDLVTYFSVQEEHTGAPGILHGGALMTLFDSALGFRAFQLAFERGCATSTVEMKVNFLKPVKLGQRLRVHPEIISSGQSLIVLSGEAIELESGVCVGFALGTFNIFTPSHLKHSSISKSIT